MALTVYGITTCGTVKKARKWLEEHDIDYDWVDFRKTPPSPDQVERWVAAFGSKAMRNTSGGAYRRLPDAKKSWDDATWTARFTDDPMLIRRPVIERDGEPVRVGWRASDAELLDQLS